MLFSLLSTRSPTQPASSRSVSLVSPSSAFITLAHQMVPSRSVASVYPHRFISPSSAAWF
ncbi:hypothetical protein CASFOL_029652 [Castilleja foliolosa]|uniref:Uncharacterized protein n=1 Tax=Castilleja foliolosa TaxID=1961234 RepID=A0ABD3C981_9LAMI